MDSLAIVIILALVVEQLLQIFKDILNLVKPFPNKCKPLTLQAISLAFGIILAYNTNISAFDILGIKMSNPHIGIIITGLVIGKGSNFAHDFFHVLTSRKGDNDSKNGEDNSINVDDNTKNRGDKFKHHDDNSQKRLRQL